VGAWEGFGPSAPFFFGGGLAILAALLMILWRPQKLANADEEQLV
jgi:hypothetical protein